MGPFLVRTAWKKLWTLFFVSIISFGVIHLAPGDPASLLLARRQRLLRVSATFGEKPKNRWKLAESPEATPEQKARLEAWLRSAQTAAPGIPGTP